LKTFLQFFNEAAHSAGPIVHDWGILHHETGEKISGQEHPTHQTHADMHLSFGDKTYKKRPEYVHYNQVHAEHGQTLHVRSYSQDAHKTLQKGLKHLPIANHYEHDYRDKRGNAAFKTFSSEKELHRHLSNLAR
jgi:hypothetical protein